MYARDQDAEAHPLRHAVPALQRFKRLSAPFMSATDSDGVVEGLSTQLLAYLSGECSNTKHSDAVGQQLGRYCTSSAAVEAGRQACENVASRAAALAESTKARLTQYEAQRADILSKLASVDPNATSSAVQERHFIGVPGAASAGLPGSPGVGGGASAPNVNLSCVWRLSYSAAAKPDTCLAVAPVTLTATLPACRSGCPVGYPLHALSAASAVVAPSLVRLQYIALTSGSVQDAAAVAQACVTDLATTLQRTDGRRSFACLEVSRHYVLIALTEGLPSVKPALGRVEGDLRDAAIYVQQLDTDIAESRKLQQHPAALIALRDAAAQVLREYAFFFHLVTSLVECVESHDFGKLVAALDARSCALYGTYRYPTLSPWLLTVSNGHAQRRQARDPTNGTNISTVVWASESGRGGGGVNKEAVMGSMVPFSGALVALMTCAIMPAPSFATLFLLSSLATQPMAEVISVCAGVTEMAVLMESCTILLDLLRALERGQWGVVYTCARQAAEAHLAHEPLLPLDGVRALVADVRAAVCFQYLRARSTVSLEAAAKALQLPGGSRELTLVSERLIQAGTLAARINGVTGVLRHIVAPSTTGAKRVLMDTIVASDANARETELQLRVLSAEICFGTPSVSTTDPVMLSR